ncbi:hypothetical protein [Mycoplasma sp. 480]|uniref:hypothetical protein n=1 Tax=Mycoplasma sp. 480 TaxID=3440155 RepID=UPI003F519E2E
MKTIDNYKTFSEFQHISKETIYPFIKNTIDETFDKTKDLQEKIKKAHLIFSIFIITTLVLLGLSILFVVIWLLQKNVSLTVAALVFFVLGLISSLVASIFMKKKKNLILMLQLEIQKNLNVPSIYKESIKVLDETYDYKINKEIDESNNFSLDKRHIEEVQSDLARSYDKVVLESKTSIKRVLINQKYPVVFLNLKWKCIDYAKKKGDNDRVTYVDNGIMQIDTTVLGDKGFAFELFRSSFFSKKNIEKLENKDFVKTFSPRSNNELKIRQMYTPLAMELSLKRYHDKNGVQITGLHLLSSGSRIYYTYNCSFGFMELDFPKSSDKVKILNKVYNDILVDVYSLYYLISLINNTTLYLQ